MAYLTNSIDANAFASLTGAIPYRQQTLETIERPGVDGTGYRKLGERGKPFELIARVYVADLAAAKTLLQTLDNLPNSNPVTVIRAGVTHGSFKVLEVDEIDSATVQNATGNATPGSTALLTVRFRLQG